MSDDEFDIFKLPTKRVNAAMPQKPESLPEPELDFDFIESNATKKKPTRTRKVKEAVKRQPKVKADKKKIQSDSIDLDEEELNNNEEILSPPKSKVTEGTVPRDMSPFSKLIYESVLKQQPTDLPVSRRTRSSLGASSMSPVSKLILDMGLNNPAEKPVSRRTRNSSGRRKPSPELNDKEVSPPKRTKNASKKKTNQAAAEATVAPVNARGMAGAARNRRQVAEYAARSQVLDSIDLVSAVMPRVEGFVNLDSDDEHETSTASLRVETEPTNSFDEDNPELTINLRWLGSIQYYKLRLYQTFSHLYEEISKLNNVPVENIVINMDLKLLQPTDTPLSLNLKPYHILDGCALKSNAIRMETVAPDIGGRKPPKFQLKVQNEEWKKPLIIPMKKSEAFKMLYIKCAEQMNCAVKDIKLFFDGELLEPNDTPRNQEMDGNEVIDLRRK